jgi:hypothetical protein
MDGSIVLLCTIAVSVILILCVKMLRDTVLDVVASWERQRILHMEHCERMLMMEIKHGRLPGMEHGEDEIVEEDEGEEWRGR